jgi:hypothetical protein
MKYRVCDVFAQEQEKDSFMFNPSKFPFFRTAVENFWVNAMCKKGESFLLVLYQSADSLKRGVAF